MRSFIIIASLLGLTACNENKCYTHVSWTQTNQGMKAEVLPTKCSVQRHDRNWYLAQETLTTTGDNYYLSVADTDAHVSFQAAQFQFQNDEWILGVTLQVEAGATTDFYGRFTTCTSCPTQNQVVGKRSCIEPEIVSMPNGDEQSMCLATAILPKDPIKHQ